ncbi:response regulator transcription factor [Deferribacterales bacterium RsTz2092]|nr:DNA-binding response regulator [Deferribacterales bacterium]
MNVKPVVLVVDDELKILALVKAYLESSGFEVLGAASGKSALASIESNAIDILLLDLMLPDVMGEDICRKVRERSALPIIMMTAKADEESIINGLALGADDYITKPFSLKELVARVKAALRRSSMTKAIPARLVSGSLALDIENKQATLDGQSLALTRNEYEILRLFMTHPAKVFTRDEIIDNIKGEDFDGFDRTIDTHIKNLRQKIADEPKSPKFIQTVYGMGYRFAGELDD